MTLREHRQRKLLSIRELAKLAGITPSTVQRIEQGKPAHWSTMRCICSALEVEPLDIREFVAAITERRAS